MLRLQSISDSATLDTGFSQERVAGMCIKYHFAATMNNRCL